MNERSNSAHLSVVPVAPDRGRKLADPFRPTIAGYIEGDPEPTEYIVDGLFQKREVAVLAGPEGIGKTAFCMQAMICAASGINFLGRETRRCKSLAMFFEDPTPALHNLRDRICRAYRIDPVDIEDRVGWSSRSHVNQEIYKTNRWKLPGDPTDFWKRQLSPYISNNGIELLFLDSAGCIFFGESANEVRCFLKWLIREAERMDIHITVLHHPAKARDNYYAGVKEWATVPRYHFSFDRPPQPKGEERMWWEPDPGDRLLAARKGSYIAPNDPLVRGLPVKWENGIFVEQPLPRASFPLEPHEQADLDSKTWNIIFKLIESDERVYRAASSSKSFSSWVSTWKGWREYDPSELDSSVERLLKMNRLVKVLDGKAVLVRTPGQLYEWEQKPSLAPNPNAS